MAVTPETIAVALGVPASDLTPELEAQWQMWIDDALLLIDARREPLGHVDPLDPDRLDYVVREAVVAHARRPDDATQVTVSIDDGSTSKTWRSGKGRVSIPDELWDLLGLAGGSGAFQIDTGPRYTAGWWTGPDQWSPVI